MNAFRIICLLVLFGNGIFSEEIKLGELVEQNTTWEQDGVVLLLYHIQFDAILFKIRAGFRNTNPIWLQSWTQEEFSGITMKFKLEKQWKYGTNTIGDQTVNLPEGQMKIGAGQHIGVYFPTGERMALRLKKVDPKYPLFGSEYIAQNRELSLGEILEFGKIGYLNKLAIEFYLRQNTTNTTTITSTTTIKTTKPMSNDTDSTTNKSKQTGTVSKKVLIISVCVTVGVLVLVFVIAGSVLFSRHRLASRPANQFTQISNPAYGIVLENRATTEPAKVQNVVHGQTITKTSNVYDTTRSCSVYAELDESEMKF